MVGRRRTGARLADRTGTACRAEAVSKVYGRRETAVHALRDVTLDIPSGVFTAIMGPSGSGKSTLLHCLAALDTPTTGHVFLGRTELTALSRRQQAQVRRDRIGFVFQAFNLVPTLDAMENITLPQLLAGRRPDREWLDHIVRRIGLVDRLHHRPNELSGGQQQRVALARALAGRPEVIFADEPTGNLDTSASQEMLALLRDAVDQYEQTVITVTHDPSIARYADRVLFLRDGQVVDQAHRPDVDQVVEHLRFSDDAGGDALGDELHASRPDGLDSMRSRRRRQLDEPAPGRPMVGSDDEIEVARQERWLQRIREQFEAEEQTAGRDDDERPAEVDPWATEPVDDRRDAAAPRDDTAVSAPAELHHAGPAPADDWLPPMRSWQLRARDGEVAPDRQPGPPPAWRDERAPDGAPWSRPADPDEHDDQQATTSQWAPPDSDWPPMEHGRSERRGWDTDTDTGGWRQRRDDDARARPPEGSPSDDLRDPVGTPPHDDDVRDAPWSSAGADDDRWAARDEHEQPDPWMPTADDRWRSRRGRADWRAVRDGDWPPPRYQPWPADDRDDVNGSHRPDTPPWSARRNGAHDDEPAGAGRDEGPHGDESGPWPHSDRPVPGPSGEPASDADAHPPSHDDRRDPEPFDDPWSNVWDATSGIDLADVWNPTLDHGAGDHGEPRDRAPAMPDDDAARATTSNSARDPLTPEPAGDDEIVQPVLRTPPADDQPNTPDVDEPDPAAVTDQPDTPDVDEPDPAAVTDQPEPATPEHAARQGDEAAPEPQPDRDHGQPGSEAPRTDGPEPAPQPAVGEPAPRPGAEHTSPAADEPRTSAGPALAAEPTDGGGGTQPLPALAEASHEATIETPVSQGARAPSGRDTEPQGADRGDSARHGPPRRRSGARPADADLPAALASLRNTRRPDETADPAAALESLQAQLDRLGSASGRPTDRPLRHSGRSRPTPPHDRD